MQHRCFAPYLIRQILVSRVCVGLLGCSLQDGNATLAAGAKLNQPSDSFSPTITLLEPVLNGEGASATATIAASGQIDTSSLFFIAMVTAAPVRLAMTANPVGRLRRKACRCASMRAPAWIQYSDS